LLLFTLLDFLEILLDTIRVDQTLLQVLATIVHGEALSHLFFNLDHVVENFNRKILVTLEVDSWILSSVEIGLT